MEIEELQESEMYVLCAPDGSIQLTTLAPDFPSCVGFIKLLHKSGMGKSFHALMLEGFKVMPVKITIKQNGDKNTAFKK